ncbi:MAG: protein-L-isoaspartate(D-aspartate) O-methyltransferase [Litorilinea sp.]
MGMAEANGHDPHADGRADEPQDSSPTGHAAPDWSDIRDVRVLHALEVVPRAAFVPYHLRRWAMRDAPLPIGCKQTISQPYIVAKMTQALNLAPGESVLEIGTGSGFQTAILCELTAVAGRTKGEGVYSLERYSSLAQKAEARLQRLSYFPAVLWGDGARGWPEARQFDAIMVTAAPKALPRPLWHQLREGGRMVIPIGGDAEMQLLWLLRKVGERVVGSRLGAVRFVPLISPILDDPAQCVALDG